MKISIITVFPELYEAFLATSLIKRAQEQHTVAFNLVRFSDMCEPKERIDEPTCGPGAGMIIKPEVLQKAIEFCEKKHGKGIKIFFSPQGDTLTQHTLKSFPGISDINAADTSAVDTSAVDTHLILVCTRYEGIDARVEEVFADHVISIGDYVLMGGDLAAQVFIEGLLRLLPDVVGTKESVEEESFSSHFLDYPAYGLPQVWHGKKIPDIVLSGNHGAINTWRKDQAAKKTVLHRFDWFRSSSPDKEAVALAKPHIPNHYVALMHSQILIKGKEGNRVGHSSVTSLDLHDIARSSATYGIQNMFMVSALDDQRAIMDELLNFWKSPEGKAYNRSRYQAISRVVPTPSLQEAIAHIEAQEGKKPLIITTSAKQHAHAQTINFNDQHTVWGHGRPVLFLFGTGQGLCDAVIAESDFLLVPVTGMTEYAHLSVRSAVAIILDRWIGLNPI